MRDCFVRDVNADDVFCDLRKHRTAIAFTACNVEYGLAASDLSTNQVSMNMFEPDLATFGRKVPLARKFQGLHD